VYCGVSHALRTKATKSETAGVRSIFGAPFLLNVRHVHVSQASGGNEQEGMERKYVISKERPMKKDEQHAHLGLFVTKHFVSGCAYLTFGVSSKLRTSRRSFDST
jgi:hypothetical protein